MSARGRGRLRPTVAGLLLGAAGACGGDEPAAGPPLVVATIFPVADLVAGVGGEAVRVETLLPPRASVHTWEATPGQIRSLGRARGYVTVGGGMDSFLEGMAADAPDLRTLRITDGLELLRAEGGRGHDHSGGEHDHASGEEGTGDPHVWLDPILVRDHVLPRVTGLLIGLAPDHAEAIRGRSRAMADSLTALDAEIRDVLSRRRTSVFIATHDAWGYFARRYGLRALGNLYESPGHEPSARGLARLMDAARAEGLGAVLTEPQLSETAARALAAEVGGQVIVVDPLGGPGLDGRERYLDMMRFNARAFAAALGSP